MLLLIYLWVVFSCFLFYFFFGFLLVFFSIQVVPLSLFYTEELNRWEEKYLKSNPKCKSDLNGLYHIKRP